MAGRPIERTAYLNCRQLDVCLVGVCRQQVDQLMQLVYVYAGKYTHYIYCVCICTHTIHVCLGQSLPTVGHKIWLHLWQLEGSVSSLSIYSMLKTYKTCTTQRSKYGEQATLDRALINKNMDLG